MQLYVIHHLGYAFWLTYEKIIPARRDRTNTLVTIVEIWRGLDPVDPAAEPLFAELLKLGGEGHGERQALERLQKTLAKTASQLELPPLTEGAVEISNKTLGLKGRAVSRTGGRSGSRGGEAKRTRAESQPAKRQRGKGETRRRTGKSETAPAAGKAEAKPTAADKDDKQRSRSTGKRRGRRRGQKRRSPESKAK